MKHDIIQKYIVYYLLVQVYWVLTTSLVSLFYPHPCRSGSDVPASFIHVCFFSKSKVDMIHTSKREPLLFVESCLHKRRWIRTAFFISAPIQSDMEIQILQRTSCHSNFKNQFILIAFVHLTNNGVLNLVHSSYTSSSEQ